MPIGHNQNKCRPCNLFLNQTYMFVYIVKACSWFYVLTLSDEKCKIYTFVWIPCIPALCRVNGVMHNFRTLGQPLLGGE